MDLIVVIVTISSIIIIFLVKRLRYFHSLITTRVPCHCEQWREFSRLRLAPEVIAGQNYEIAEAFRHLQIIVRRFNFNRPLRVVSAEKILLHAAKLVNEDAVFDLIKSAVEREYTFVASCLNDAWPLLSPKVCPGRTYVKLFCQNFKSHKDLCYSTMAEAHSHFELFGSMLDIENFVTQKAKMCPSEDQEKVQMRRMKHTLIKFGPGLKVLSDRVKSIIFNALILAGIKKVIALDTEMVGAGFNGHINMVARVSLVDKNHCIYDKFVKPIKPVTDYRTFVSGISAPDLIDATDFKTVQKEVADLIRKRILVGHDLEKDLAVLNLQHPEEDIRDTAMFPPFRRVPHEKPSLKDLSRKLLYRDIQSGGHSSVEDATAAMDLYLKVAEQWEEMLK